jgi:hypothetical protein
VELEHAPLDFFQAGVASTAGEQRIERYDASRQKIIQEKLSNMVYQCLLLVQTDAPTQERVRQMSTQESHIVQFKSPNYGFLGGYQEAWPDSIQHVTTLEQALDTDIIGLLDSWLSNESTKWRNFRLVLDAKELAALWHLPHEGFTAPNIDWIRGKHVPLPSDMRGKNKGVCLGDNRYAGKKEPVYMLAKDRATHMIVVGKTGMGKSTFLHNLIRQDIANGSGVAVIDPSPGGSLIRAILQQSIPESRERDVCVWDLANWQHPPPLNFLRLPPGVRRQEAASSVMAIFEKIYGAEFSATRMGRTLAAAVQTLMADKTATIRDIARLYRDPGYRKDLVEQVESEATRDFWEDFETMTERDQREHFAPILWRIEGLYDSPLLYPVVCYPYAFNLRTVIRSKRIFLVSLGASADARLAPHEQAFRLHPRASFSLLSRQRHRLTPLLLR